MDVGNDHSGLPSTGRPNDRRYQVFVSFRGGNVRRDFIPFLREGLANLGIRSFINYEGIDIGETIMAGILQLIRHTEICIPIFSKDFASSEWCLMEVAEMVKHNRTILPIFYDVSPEVVCKQQESYRLSFRIHEDRGVESTTINKWKKALRSVSERPGWDREKYHDRYSELIEQVVSEVYRFLRGDHLNGSFRGWQKGELLGRGAYGSVYKGFTDNGRSFAVKEVSLLDQDSQGQESLLQLEQEIFFFHQLKHANIVQYLGTDKDDKNLYIFLELMTEGSLKTLYGKYKLGDSQVSAYTRQILMGLKYLHDRNVIHRDIKCANILVGVNGLVKLADFGLAKVIKSNNAISSKGTFSWMAPEVVNPKNRGYGLPADIWSLGCTVLEMLTRRYPYHDLEPMQALFRIGKGKPPSIPDSLSRNAQSFILECLQVNPDNRPSAAQLLGHPFVASWSILHLG